MRDYDELEELLEVDYESLDITERVRLEELTDEVLEDGLDSLRPEEGFDA